MKEAPGTVAEEDRLQEFWRQRFVAHVSCGDCPSVADVKRWFSRLFGLLFEQHGAARLESLETFEAEVDRIQRELTGMIADSTSRQKLDPEQVAGELAAALPTIHAALLEDADATVKADPAANDRDVVVRAYLGFFATAAYRVAHVLHGAGATLLARMLGAAAHSVTGIDIHPAARIGRRFCIDHGTGVVIGETSEIGDDVKLYQGVTLGGLSVNKADAASKRHPTIEDRVVIYSGATILGGDTVVGHDSIIGGNVWLTRAVPPFSKLTYRATVETVSAGFGSGAKESGPKEAEPSMDSGQEREPPLSRYREDDQ